MFIRSPPARIVLTRLSAWLKVVAASAVSSLPFCALKPCKQKGLIQPEPHGFMPAGCREIVGGSHCLMDEFLNCPTVRGKSLPTSEGYLEPLPLRDARPRVLLSH